MILIGTEQACKDYDAIIVKGENYQPPTIAHFGVRKHPTKELYSIPEHPSYPIADYPELDLTAVDQLGDDWVQEIE